MKPQLLTLICCPVCRGELRLTAVEQESSDEVLSGTLLCGGCTRTFAIVNGVPRLIANLQEVERTKLGFEHQWFRRLRGKYEPRAICYGFPVGEFVGWLMDLYGASLKGEGGKWILDAGCGSAEKTRALATTYPQHEVIGLDLSDSLAFSFEESRQVPNLHFVQGDVMYPPLRRERIDFALGIGILHHTPDTRRAFEALAGLVTKGGTLLTWIYPKAEEHPFWATLYRQRDRYFFGLGSRLPRSVLMFLCHAHVAALFPLIVGYLKTQAEQNRQRYPFVPERARLSQVYKTAVFLSFDNLMPSFQNRHSRDEVVSWYKDLGFGEVDTRFIGFFYGASRSLP